MGKRSLLDRLFGRKKPREIPFKLDVLDTGHIEPFEIALRHKDLLGIGGREPRKRRKKK